LELYDELNDALSKAEVKVVYDPRLTVADKIVKLTVLRGERTTIPKSFKKRITKADAFHARALGIRL